MKPSTHLIAALLLALASVGCEVGSKSGRGFRLPEGDEAKGKAAFLALQCNTCHTVQGVELPKPLAKSPIAVAIGGKVATVRSYGELVTSIINPAHGLAPGFDKKQMGDSKVSPMPEYNQSMTTQQLIDLVAFLYPRYENLDPGPYYYMH
jgi:L-cysteine S-thiosulfotransferase